MVCRETGLDPESVEKVVVTFYDDYSGFDENNCYLRLKSGAKSILKASAILSLAAEVVPELPDKYKVISWDVPELFRGDGGKPILSDCEVDVLFGPDPTSVNSEHELRSYLEVLLSCERKYKDRVWWGRDTIGHDLVKSAIFAGNCKLLQEMVGGGDREDRTLFLLAVAIVEELDRSHAQQAQPLVTMLLGPTSPLNDHWKGVLAGKLRP